MIVFLEGGRGYIAACDRCHTRHQYPPTSTTRAARRAANRNGWKVLRGRRCCPNCRNPQATPAGECA